MRVFLIHGMGRSKASMALLAARLRRAGHPVSSFGYAVTRHSVEEISARFVDHIEKTLRPPRESDGRPIWSPDEYAVVGHSLGNIITRHGASRLPAGFARFVMLAPPNNPPVLARTLRENPLFKLLTQDGGRKLADPEYYRTLPVPDVPTLVIAGDRGPRAEWLPFAGTHDGIVGLDETKLRGVPLHIVPALHTFIMNHPQVVKVIHHFLQTGRPPDDHEVPGHSTEGAPVDDDASIEAA